jgi:hypothetical protein
MHILSKWLNDDIVFLNVFFFKKIEAELNFLFDSFYMSK